MDDYSRNPPPDRDAEEEQSNSSGSGLTRRRLLSATAFVGTTGALAGGGTEMFFSDAETFVNNSHLAGKLDLGIAWEEYYNGDRVASLPGPGFESYTDSHEAAISLDRIEPDDQGTLVTCVQLYDGVGDIWLRIVPGRFAENGVTDDEAVAGDDPGSTTGELQNYLDVDLWYDTDQSNGNVVEGDSIGSGTLAEVTDQWRSGGLIAENAESVCIGLRWELPDGVSPIVVSDSVEFTVEFAAQQQRSQENPWR